MGSDRGMHDVRRLFRGVHVRNLGLRFVSYTRSRDTMRQGFTIPRLIVKPPEHYTGRDGGRINHYGASMSTTLAGIVDEVNEERKEGRRKEERSLPALGSLGPKSARPEDPGPGSPASESKHY